jgi:FAD/FMN-containing dehydrogenase/Fe-S oxidoreductase
MQNNSILSDAAAVEIPWQWLSSQLRGELYFDESPEHHARRMLYATDASVYQEKPLAVAIPLDEGDLQSLIHFARQHQLSLIPRAAGTSLAGQVVGNGIVVDISRHFHQILELNQSAGWAWVQPGIVRDDLNVKLRPFGLFFGPETSTSSRAMIGGMVGNNSSGLHSIIWGDTRSQVLALRVLLSDGTAAEFRALSADEYARKCQLDNLEGEIYRALDRLLNSEKTQRLIEENYPVRSLQRRNTGYALDMLSDNQVYRPDSKQPFNLCQLIAGSEGTLAFVTEVKIRLLPLPPAHAALVCIHCHSIRESLLANLVALRHRPMASELVDKFILDFTADHPTYQKNRFFIQGNPAAILMVEFMADDWRELETKTQALLKDLQDANLGYAFPVVFGEEAKLVWDVRKAGLGLIRNMRGEAQPVNLIEDCAVSPEDLPDYIADLEHLLAELGVKACYYAHAGAGELHVEPLLNLKEDQGKRLFRTILEETTQLVKKYRGSLSGEHGDGRLRGEYIASVLGEEVYALLKAVKKAFDPQGVFNAGKITDTPPMDQFLRYDATQKTAQIRTYFDFSAQEGILRLAEKCSGSGDCRKTELTGGTMCPSYMATRSEKDSTRARANILRQFLSNDAEGNPFNRREIYEVMDLCLSCKGCKAECPSQVDVAKMKAEFLQHYYRENGVPLRAWLIGHFAAAQRLVSAWPVAYNFLIKNRFTAGIIKQLLGFSRERSLPVLNLMTLQAWFRRHKSSRPANGFPNGRVYLFCDEFTNYNDLEIGTKAVLLLEKLGYEVLMPQHLESGRALLSKGLVLKAQRLAIRNVDLLDATEHSSIPIIGLEPSAILTLRDEYLELVPADQREKAQRVANRTLLIDEFLAREAAAGKVTAAAFTRESKLVKLHGHCHQKALSSLLFTQTIISLPENYKTEVIPSGCCGMAGSFGYEAEHYEISMKIGELVLFPAIRSLPQEVVVAAPGTSCRHQIMDGTGRRAFHPVEILWEALCD